MCLAHPHPLPSSPYSLLRNLPSSLPPPLKLGNGNTTYQIQPRAVPGMEEVKITQIATGGWHSLALTEDGQVGGLGGIPLRTPRTVRRGGWGRFPCTEDE